MNIIGAGFRGKRGRVMICESTQVSTVGGPTPHSDWKPQEVKPDLAKALPREMLIESRNSIMNVFGVLPLMFDKSVQGQSIREGQRHLAGWTLQPIAATISEEASNKLWADVVLDVLRPVQAYDARGRARALNGYLEALSRAKEAGLSAEDVNSALTAVNWGEGDRAA